MLYSILKAENDRVVLEFGHCLLITHISSFDLPPKETFLARWKNGKFYIAQKETADKKARLYNLAQKLKNK